ncbi:nuclear transport factor 2 family protein [Streptomyces sp. NPDC088910]|uniref:nuclear transport factor 2 family protein n=1 Tax=Streptomyces sp. NPDC088910 TaxID=3365911 RepID=UPI003819C5F2
MSDPAAELTAFMARYEQANNSHDIARVMQPRSGEGRGTNVIVKRDGAWKMLHEHLSP